MNEEDGRYTPPIYPCRWLAIATSKQDPKRYVHHVTERLKTAQYALKEAEVALGMHMFHITVYPLEDE